MFSYRFCAASAAFFLSLAVACAQDSRGIISGRVIDPSGSAIPNVVVRTTNIETGVHASNKTGESGNFTIPYLEPGRYHLEVEQTGFKKYASEIQVRTNDTLEVNVNLQVGDVNQSVEVRAETPLLATGEVSVGQVIDQKRIEELPLFAGNAMDLVQLAPGTVNGTDLRLRKAPFNNAPSQFSTVGGSNYQNEFTIDGVSNTYSDGTQPRVAFSPPQTAINEFKIKTTSFDAMQGATLGSVVNVNTKGGTNSLHGELHYWFRHSKLDTKTIFQNRQGLGLPIYQDNRYGGSLGGPVTLPKLYDGHNRTFWFFAYEGNKFGDPNAGQGLQTVPTAAERRGDLSGLLALGPAYQVYDPATTVALANGRFQRQPFPRNVIPANRLDPVALRILDYFPAPNAAGTSEGRQNYFRPTKAIEDYWTTIARFDHAFSERFRTFVRVHRDYWQEDKNRIFPNISTGLILNRINRGIALDNVFVISPSFLLNLRYGITQQEFPEQRVSRGFDLTSLGFSSQLASSVNPSLATFPRVNVQPWSILSNWESGDGATSSIIHNPVAALTYLRGKHSMSFGGDFRFIREFRNRYPADVSPDLNFNASFTNGPFNTSASPQLGGQVASFLLGIPAGSISRTASYAEQNSIYGFYLQDDYKLTTKVTLNLGVRYELETPMTERFNRSVTAFDYTTANPIEAAARANYARAPLPELPANQFRVLGGPTFAGANGNPRQFWNSDKNNIAPRFGIAYSIRPKTVLRAGYGVYFGPIGTLYTNSIQSGFTQSTPIQASLNSGLSFQATLANPFPNGVLPPPGNANGLATNLGQDITFFDRSRVNPYSQRWSFGFQQELPFKFVADVSYIGNRVTSLSTVRDLNATPNNLLSTSAVRDQARIDFLDQVFPNPFNGLSPVFTQNTSREQLRLPYPQFNSVSVLQPVGYAWYHSMQAKLERRFTEGFSYQMSATWSKSMQAVEFLNGADPVPYRSISDLDRTWRVTASGIWEIPFGTGRRFGRSLPRLVEGFAGGWQINGMMQFQSGGPLGFGNAIFNGNLADIPLPSDVHNVDRWFNTNAGFERRGNAQLDSNLRTFPIRFSGIRGPGQQRWDFSLIKNFYFAERWRFQVRAETYNAWNNVNLGNPNTTPSNSAFGTITTQNPPRSWQFATKLSF